MGVRGFVYKSLKALTFWMSRMITIREYGAIVEGPFSEQRLDDVMARISDYIRNSVECVYYLSVSLLNEIREI